MFQQTLNGLNAYSRALDTIGHNLSNSENVGFKRMILHFSDTATSSTSNGNTGGVAAPTTSTEFKQGNIVDTNNPLDMAIRGNGFFQVQDATSGDAFYTRNGQFRLKISSIADSGALETQKSYLVDGGGHYLMGWQAGQPSTGTTSPILISHNTNPGKPTSQVKMNVNLESGLQAIDSGTAFNPDNPLTFSWATSVKAYDSKGEAHTLATYYVKRDTFHWDVYTRLDKLSPTEAEPQSLEFSTTNKLANATPLTRTFSLPAASGATIPSITIDLAGSTQYDIKSTLNQASDDGYSYGYLQNFSVAYDGSIMGEYSNGHSASLGRVALARFTSPEGLLAVGGNLWAETPESGTVQLWPDTSKASASGAHQDQLEGWGVIQPKAIEQSSTDTAGDLINLVVMQRNYQANAKGVETQDKMLQSLLDIR